MELNEVVDSTATDPPLRLADLGIRVPLMPLTRGALLSKGVGNGKPEDMLLRFLRDPDGPSHWLNVAWSRDLEINIAWPGQNPSFRIQDLKESTHPLRRHRAARIQRRRIGNRANQRSAASSIASSSSYQMDFHDIYNVRPGQSVIMTAPARTLNSTEPPVGNGASTLGVMLSSNGGTQHNHHYRPNETPLRDALGHEFAPILCNDTELTNYIYPQHLHMPSGDSALAEDVAFWPYTGEGLAHHAPHERLDERNVIIDSSSSAAADFSDWDVDAGGSSQPEQPGTDTLFDEFVVIPSDDGPADT